MSEFIVGRVSGGENGKPRIQPVAGPPSVEARIAHLATHLPPRGNDSSVPDQQILEVIPDLARPLSLDEIGALHNFSRSQVETRWFKIAAALIPRRRWGANGAFERVALVRFLYGIDKCWCER